MNNEELRFFAEVVETIADNRDEVYCDGIDPTRMLELADKFNLTGLLHILQAQNKLIYLQPAYKKILQDKYDTMFDTYTAAIAEADVFYKRLKKAKIPFLLTGETAVHKMIDLYGCFNKNHFEILVPQEYLSEAKSLLQGAPVSIGTRLEHINVDSKTAGSLLANNCVEACLLCLELCKSAPPNPSFQLLVQIYLVMTYGDFNYSVLYQIAQYTNSLTESRRVFRLIAKIFPTVKLTNLFQDYLG